MSGEAGNNSHNMIPDSFGDWRTEGIPEDGWSSLEDYVDWVENQEKNNDDSVDGETFQVAPGINKEDEFKRITGEEWGQPDGKYEAVCVGVDDNEDYPMENWVIRKRTQVDESEEKNNDDSVDGETFQVAPGINKEDEFKRITGEEWGQPDGKYEAVCVGVDDNEDYPMENWVIRKRTQVDESEEDKPEENKSEEDKPEEEEDIRDYLARKGYTDEQIDDAVAEGFKVGDQELDQWEGETMPLGEKRDNKSVEEQEEAEEEARTKAEEEAKKKAEEEARAKAEEEARAKAEEEARAKAGEGVVDEEGQQTPEQFEEQGPLVAINADFEYDKKELAHDLAEQELNRELEGSKGIAKFVKQIWKGNLFKKYYEMKYTHDFENGDRTIKVDGKEESVDSLIEGRSSDAIKRFVLGVSDEFSKSIYVHNDAGEKVKEASEQLTADIRKAIEEYATASIGDTDNLEDLKNQFNNDINRAKAEAISRGEIVDEKWINNYLEVAVQARERVEHGLAIDKVMDGFKVYNAEVRDGIRTEAHRDNIDKLINKIESSAVGRFVPPEAIAFAASVATSFAQTGARAAAGAVGGLAVSGIFAGLRERNRVVEDRTQMVRDSANGLEREEPSRRNEKYEAKLGGTMYKMERAKDLTDTLMSAIESGNEESILQAIAQAKVRIDYSDSEKKDLIAYSSEDARGAERLALDKALFTAIKKVGNKADALSEMSKAVHKEIADDVDEKDENFRKLKVAQAMKQAGKTVAIGALTFFASQEISSVIGPGNENRIGLIEKITGKGNNNDDASETILARLVGGRGVHTETVSNISEADVARYQKNGYSVVENPGNTHMDTTLEEVDASQATGGMKAKWQWANNGTRPSDGNELRIQWSGEDHGGFVSKITGNSTMPNGEAVSSDGLIGILTIKGKTFECVPDGVDSAGRAIFGKEGVFTLTDGSTVKAIDDSGKFIGKYFQMAKDMGTNADGTRNLISFATEVGSDGPVKVSQLVDKIIKEPSTFTATKTVVRDVFKGGIIAPFVRRKGIGGVERPAAATPDNGEEIMTDDTEHVGGYNHEGQDERTPEDIEAIESELEAIDAELEGLDTTDNKEEEASVSMSPDRGEGEGAPVSSNEVGGGEGSSSSSEQQSSNLGDNNKEEAGGVDYEHIPLPSLDGGSVMANLNGGVFKYAGEEFSAGNEEGQFVDEQRLEEFSNAHHKYIERYKDVIGGDEGVEIMTDITPYSEDKDERYERWWNSLSDTGKATISVNMNNFVDGNGALVPWNAGLRVWLLKHGYKNVEDHGANPGNIQG